MHPYTSSMPISHIPLHWCHDVRPCSGTALYVEQINTQPSIWRLPSIIFKSSYENLQDNCTSCLASPLPSKWIYFIFIFVIMLMSACCSLRFHSPLKTVFGKIGDTYQAYCHMYKTHTMATCHGGSGQHLDRDINVYENTAIKHAQEFHHINTNDFEYSETNNPARLTAITRELDDLCQQVQAWGQPSEALNHIECKLQRLSIWLHPSAPPEPLEEVLKHYTDTLCCAQKQTNFATSLLQDIPYLLDMILHYWKIG